MDGWMDGSHFQRERATQELFFFTCSVIKAIAEWMIWVQDEPLLLLQLTSVTSVLFMLWIL